MTKTAAERSLLRIQDEMAKRKLTQRDMAKRLGCSQGKVAKLMKGRVNLRVNDLAALSEAVGLHLSETIRDRGFEFYAEMSPNEAKLLEEYRQWSMALRGAVLIAAGVIPPPVEHRSSASKALLVSTRKRPGRPKNSTVE